MAEKALQNNPYLESYTTAPEHRLSSRDAGYFFFFRREFGGDLLLKIIYNLGGGRGANWRSYGRPGPLPRQGSPEANSLFTFKPSRLAGAISADVRSAERACRSELIMRERRLRSE